MIILHIFTLLTWNHAQRGDQSQCNIILITARQLVFDCDSYRIQLTEKVKENIGYDYFDCQSQIFQSDLPRCCYSNYSRILHSTVIGFDRPNKSPQHSPINQKHTPNNSQTPSLIPAGNIIYEDRF